ncbi:MAG: alpha/beta fold hydrolase [bacterium]|nr:alpha/beta fold hydrolase [bacterium]
MSSEAIAIEVGDGHRIVVEVFEGATAEAVVLILPAMGVAAGYYSDVIAALVDVGLAVAIADWRGHGTSNLRASRSVNWGYRHLVEVDVSATLQAVKDRFPDRPVYALGHSLGGQIASLHAAAFPGEFAGIALIASVTLDHRDWGFPRSWGVLAFTQSVRAITMVLGYFPGNRFHFAGREGRQQMIDWASNGLNGRWVLGGSTYDYESLLAEIAVPVLMMSIDGDSYTPDRAIATHLGKMPRADVTRHQWTAVDLEPGGLHHLRWVRHSEPIVRKLREWIG